MAMTLRTDPELDAALDALSSTLRISKQEVLRRAVLEKLERDGHQARVDEVAVRVLSDYAEALDRLGKV